MKKILLLLCAGLMLTASCMDNFDDETVPTSQFTAKNLPEPNTTISKIRSQYANAISNSTYEQVKDTMVFDGIVVANDISGNIYQFIYVQEVDTAGCSDTSKGGIAIGVKGMACLYTLFPVGQRVRVNLKDLYVGGYGKAPRIGLPYINTNGAMRLGPMTLPYLAEHVELIGQPDASKVKPLKLLGSDFAYSNTSKTAALTPILVELDNAEISDAGMPYAHWEVGGDVYSEYHDITINGVTAKNLLYTSTSATFAGDTIQKGKKTIYGLLNQYSGSLQLSLRSLDDIQEIAQ